MGKPLVLLDLHQEVVMIPSEDVDSKVDLNLFSVGGPVDLKQMPVEGSFKCTYSFSNSAFRVQVSELREGLTKQNDEKKIVHLK